MDILGMFEEHFYWNLLFLFSARSLGNFFFKIVYILLLKCYFKMYEKVFIKLFITFCAIWLCKLLFFFYHFVYLLHLMQNVGKERFPSSLSLPTAASLFSSTGSPVAHCEGERVVTCFSSLFTSGFPNRGSSNSRGEGGGIAFHGVRKLSILKTIH